jgi:hypothetical protein
MLPHGSRDPEREETSQEAFLPVPGTACRLLWQDLLIRAMFGGLSAVLGVVLQEIPVRSQEVEEALIFAVQVGGA